MTGCSYPSISLSSCLFVSFTHIKHAWVGTFCTIIGDGGRSKGEGGLILSLPSAGIRHVSAPPFPLPLRKYIYFNLQLIFHSQKRVNSTKNMSSPPLYQPLKAKRCTCIFLLVNAYKKTLRQFHTDRRVRTAMQAVQSQYWFYIKSSESFSVMFCWSTLDSSCLGRGRQKSADYASQEDSYVNR